MPTYAEFIKPIQIFDLDGTLTIEFDPDEGDRTGEKLDTYNYWHRITRKLARDPEAFDAREKTWLEMVMATKNIDMISSLIERTKSEITMFDEGDKNDESIRKQATLITHDFLDKGIVELDAIRYLEHQLIEGVICAISTGGDESGAAGFVDGLVERGLLSKDLADNIHVSGTRINWDEMTVKHLNVGPLKLRGLELVFQKPIDDIQKRTQAVFGNDPERGDRALLDDFCPYSFVKKTIKNEKAILPLNCVFFSSLDKVYDYRYRISDLHARSC
jgi:hypothetical protein